MRIVRVSVGAIKVLPAAWMLASCTGSVTTGEQPRWDAPADPGPWSGSGGFEAPGPAACPDHDPADVGESALPRLTRAQYQLTLQQLFQLPAPPDVEPVPADAAHDGITSYTELQAMSAQHLRGYLAVTEQLTENLFADPARQAAVIGCELPAAGCLDDFVTRFGRLSYRRPLTMAEVSAITTAARAHGSDERDRFGYAIEALLLSPNFLYRVELGTPVVAGPAGLSDTELASRLSFALLGHGPSEGLMDQAAQGALATPAGLAGVVDLLLQEPEIQAYFGTFFEEWLGFAKLVPPKVPPGDWDDGLLLDMKAETGALVDRFAWSSKNFLDVLTTNQTVVSPALARFYGLPEPGPDGLVDLPETHARAHAGLLGHASLLSLKSDGDRIAVRGNWLRRTFLCRSLEIPAEIAEQFDERLVGLTPTEIVRERNTDGACRGCHAMIDPIGIGFEGFGPAGRFDPAFVVPDYGVQAALPDAPDPAFSGVSELAAKLRALPEVAQCLTDRTYLFVHGRDPAPEDDCTVSAAADGFVASGYDYRELVKRVVTAPAFRLRRTPETTPVATGERP